MIIWKVGTTRLAGALERLEYRNEDRILGNAGEFKRTAYYVLVEQRVGEGSFWSS